MTNISFNHQNVLYHVFDINLLSYSESINLHNIILDLQKPQIICSCYRNSISQQKSTKHAHLYFPVNHKTTPHQNTLDNLNNVSITEPLLDEKTKIRQKKRYYSQNQLQYDSEFVRNSDEVSSVFVRSTKSYPQQTNNKQVKVVSETKNIDQNLDLNTKLQNTTTVLINHPLTISDLSKLIFVPESEIIKALFLKGIKVTINQIVSVDIATFIAQYYGFTVKNNIHENSVSSAYHPTARTPLNTHSRAPVIAILGHRDHGKTSVLSAIRNNQHLVQQSHTLTQLIKAYETDIHFKDRKQKVIFLDTPGHPAFVNMRSLSIRMTDFIMLVIAADDGISSQTIEVMKYIKTTKIPTLIVINKVDKVSIDIDQMKRQILNHDMVPEAWKSNIFIVPISVTTGKNIERLISCIIELTQKHNLKGNPHQKATGIIFNSFLDKNKGPVGNVIVQNGTLYVGDFIVAGSSVCKVRAITSNQNIKLRSASLPSVVEVWGFSEVPIVGCTFITVNNEKKAKKLGKQHSIKDNILLMQKQVNFRITIQESSNLQQVSVTQQVNIILKTGTQGFIEVILLLFSHISQSKAQLNIMSAATGMIIETDIRLAVMSKSLVIGFNTVTAPSARLSAKKHGVDIYEYEIIDDLMYGIQQYISNRMEIENMENLIGTAIVRSVFTLAIGVIAGCTVESGKVIYNSIVEISRNKSVIYKGKLKSLKHIKIDILEAKQGEEFGLSVVDFDAWQINDRIKFYRKSINNFYS